jgi:hypothetical protein
MDGAVDPRWLEERVPKLSSRHDCYFCSRVYLPRMNGFLSRRFHYLGSYFSIYHTITPICIECMAGDLR